MSVGRRVVGGFAATLLIAGLTVAGASSASAGGITGSTVTSVTGAPPGYTIADGDHPTAGATITVEGTASGAGPDDTVDIRCYYNDDAPYDSTFLAGDVPITSGHWTATAKEAAIAYGSCRLVAVPPGWSTPLSDPESASFIPSAVLTIGEATSSLRTTGPNSGTVYDFDISVAGAKAFNELNSADSCGPYSHLTTPAVHAGAYLWDCVFSLFQADQGDDNDPLDHHGLVEVAGHLAVTPDSLDDSLALTHGAIHYHYAQNATTGDAVIAESDPFYFCLDASQHIVDSGSSSCAGIRYTGVTLHRSYHIGHGGQAIVISDQFTSTDHASHPLALEYENEFNDLGSPPLPGFKAPGASTFSTPASDTAWDTHSWPRIGTLYAVHDPAGGAVSVDDPAGAMTWSAKPSSVFVHSPNSMFFNYTERIPAGGSWTVTQSLALAASQTTVNHLARLQARADRPSMKAKHLAKRSKTKFVVVHGHVTNGGNGAITTVKAVSRGHKKTAKVSSKGKFAVRVRLVKGRNKIVISGTDPAGYKAHATVSTRYVKPKPKHRARATR